ncbi:phosphate transport system permease protein [Acrocarpospora pleiomorpha]|uniref:Phosphate transport system permease protein n=1 Tax=Acrocarpospora pleiomorpha TaxID=90975 RepID=A0A5M3XK93_9ACTN|nr:phosphate ABC transporter permease subunit PstC [Acrocarpospora pleiomorpha]GES18528.1 phosphate transport system permease protein [Acrocarpospora pleiomorpha]
MESNDAEGSTGLAALGLGERPDPPGPSNPSDPPSPPGPPGPPADEGPLADEGPRRIEARLSGSDRFYRALASTGAGITLLIIVLIGVFLLLEALPAFQAAGFDFLTTQPWNPDSVPPEFGVAAMMFGTAVTAIVAMLVTVPLALATAVFINEYAPRAIRAALTSLVDLMAAIPSLIFALWGLFFLVPWLQPIEGWLVAQLGGSLPFMRAVATGSSLFNAGLVIALMSIPITTSIIREVLSQAPRHECEGALALGGTRWGMITTVILPFGRTGIIGGSMLGLGRALGETIAATLILNIRFEIKPQIFETGGITVASGIAVEFFDAQELGLSALMAAGLSLFLVTIVINLLAAIVVERAKSVA